MAIQYKILSKKQIDETVYTQVQYVFSSPELDPADAVEVEVAHFRPESLNDVNLGISNRAQSELDKIIAKRAAQTVIEDVPTGTDLIEI